MGWRDLFTGLLAGDGEAAPTPEPGATPLSYAVARYAGGARVPLPAALAEAQRAFPDLPAAEIATLRVQVEAAAQQAFKLGSQVNQHQLTQDEAHQRLRQAFPALDAANAGRLLMQGLVDTR